MARTKATPKPYFQIRGEFHESQENMVHKLMVLMQAVDTALSLNQVLPAAAPLLREKLDALRSAVMSDE